MQPKQRGFPHCSSLNVLLAVLPGISLPSGCDFHCSVSLHLPWVIVAVFYRKSIYIRPPIHMNAINSASGKSTIYVLRPSLVDKVMEHNFLLPSWELKYPFPAGTFEDDASYLDPRNVPLDEVSVRVQILVLVIL